MRKLSVKELADGFSVINFDHAEADDMTLRAAIEKLERDPEIRAIRMDRLHPQKAVYDQRLQELHVLLHGRGPQAPLADALAEGDRIRAAKQAAYQRQLGASGTSTPGYDGVMSTSVAREAAKAAPKTLLGDIDLPEPDVQVPDVRHPWKVQV